MQLAAFLEGALDGARVLAQSALALAVAIAVVLLVAARPARRLLLGALLYGLAAATIVTVAHPVPADSIAASVLLVCGVLIAAAVRPAEWGTWTAIVAGGLASGLAGKMQTASHGEATGAALALFVVVLAGGALMRIAQPVWLHRAAAVARRTAGAWLAAIGVLMLALSLRSPA